MQKLKLDDDGHVVLQDGKPVYLDADGKDIAVDVPQMYQKIIDLGAENKASREKYQKAKSTVDLFDGVEDIATWKSEAEKALEQVANFNEKDWLKVDKVESLKRQMKEAHDLDLEAIKKAAAESKKADADLLAKKDSQIHKLLISASFAKSSLFSGDDPKTILPADVAESYFGRHFKVEESDTGELVVRAYYANGDLIYSRSQPGEPANFDEGIQEVFDKYPGKDKLIKAKSGSGGQGGEGPELTDDLAKLKKQLTETTDVQARVSLKRRISEMENARRKAA